MKKLITFAGVALMLAACANEETIIESGQIALSLNASTDVEVSAATRAVTNLTDEEAANYNIQVFQGDVKRLEPVKYDAFKTTKMVYPIGSDYTVTAESCTEEEARTANQNWGQVRYAGVSEPFAIRTNETTATTVTCRMANAKVSIMYDETFKEVFTEYSVSVHALGDEGRKCSFTSSATFESPVAYFNVTGATPKIVCEVSANFNGNNKTSTLEIDMAAAKWYKVTVKTSAAGKINLSSISVDDTVTEENQECPVNPYE